jgi:hypothetical protein
MSTLEEDTERLVEVASRVGDGHSLLPDDERGWKLTCEMLNLPKSTISLNVDQIARREAIIRVKVARAIIKEAEEAAAFDRL